MQFNNKQEIKIGLLDVVSAEIKSENGQVISSQFVQHPGSVCILALNDQNQILMIRSDYPTVLKENQLQFPTGTIRPEETPLEAAQRTLVVETGFKAEVWAEMTETFSSVEISNEKVSFFIASDLEIVADGNPEMFELDQAFTMVKSGNVTDARTVQACGWLAVSTLTQNADPEPVEEPVVRFDFEEQLLNYPISEEDEVEVIEQQKSRP
jgi:ADP-ribose pyrophosphatase